MAKFYGKVGYLSIEETSPDVYSEVLTERLYKGDVLRNQKRYQASEGLNDDVIVNNSISIVADSYAYENAFAIKYVQWMGVLWKVISIEIQRPRIILSLGGKYNV
ncbi:MAG: hypothetical protein ACLU0S_00915 [Blautia obeum]